MDIIWDHGFFVVYREVVASSKVKMYCHNNGPQSMSFIILFNRVP